SINSKEMSERILKAFIFGKKRGQKEFNGKLNDTELQKFCILDAFTRSDIPLHANAMLKVRQTGSLEKIKELKKSGREVVYVGD
ncbi:hypothetical protein VWM73_12410, partial [Campylobacter coli]